MMWHHENLLVRLMVTWMRWRALEEFYWLSELGHHPTNLYSMAKLVEHFPFWHTYEDDMASSLHILGHHSTYGRMLLVD